MEVFIIISWGLNWKSNTVWQVWKWVDQRSLLFLGVIEGAAVTEFAFSMVDEVLARLGLVVGVNGTESSLSEILWEWLLKKNIYVRRIIDVNLRRLVVSTQLVRERIGRIAQVGSFPHP